MMKHALFLSIKPKFVKRILSGIKRVELRRIRPNITTGDLVLIYASSPQKELIAYTHVLKVNQDDPKRLWIEHKTGICLSKVEFEEYFHGSKIGFAIHFSSIHEFDAPHSLSHLRKLWPGFSPPQLYQYLSPDEYSPLFKYKFTGNLS